MHLCLLVSVVYWQAVGVSIQAGWWQRSNMDCRTYQLLGVNTNTRSVRTQSTRDAYSKRWYKTREPNLSNFELGKVYMHLCLLVSVVYWQAGGVSIQAGWWQRSNMDCRTYQLLDVHTSTRTTNKTESTSMLCPLCCIRAYHVFCMPLQIVTGRIYIQLWYE